MNIILFRTDKLGDLIISTPVIRAIKAAHPYARIMLVASAYNAVAVQGLEEVESVLTYDKRMSKADKLSFIDRLRAFQPTHTLVLSPKNDCYFLSFFSGARKRGGLLMEYRWLPRLLAPVLLTHSVFIPRSRKGEHQSVRSLKLAQKMGLAKEGAYPYLIAQDSKALGAMAAQLKERGIARPFIAVHLADKWIEEAWTKDDVLAFLKKAQARFTMPVVATAGPADKILTQYMEGQMPIFQNLSFAEWVALFRQASAVITPDCGAVHIACALQKPLLALYPPSRFAEAFAEFGPIGTVFKAYALENPALQTDIFLNDLSALLEKHS